MFGVDVKFDAVRDAVTDAAARGYTVRGWAADLTVSGLPSRRFDLVVVARYLQRDLFPALVDAVAPGGFLLYETFTEAQRTRGHGPTSPDHLLKAGELPTRVGELETLFYEETADDDALARLAARRRNNPS